MEVKKPCIVIIDDSPVVRQLFKAALSQETYLIQTFQTPLDAWCEIFVRRTIPIPDLIFIDLILPPEMSGTEAIRRFRDRFPAMPIVAISRQDGAGDQLMARLAGASKYLAKPFTMQDILDVVQRFIEPA